MIFSRVFFVILKNENKPVNVQGEVTGIPACLSVTRE
jgi:hypothetical protein